nr:hypothetical protein CFP56_46647 [Quercus suber]
MASPPQPTTPRRRRTLGSFVSGASPGGSYAATRDSAMSLNPRAEAFVPATTSKRKAPSVHSTNSASLAASNASAQPPASIISSQVLFGQSRVRDSDWTALGNALRDGELTEDSTEEEGPLDLSVDVLRAHYLSLNENVQHINPHSAVLVWLGMRKPGSKTARYLPLESNNVARGSSSDLRVQSNHAWCTNTDYTRPSTCKWPSGKVPVEIFELVASSLARDDVMAMRLVNHEFEDKVSRTLFHTCVVPFNTELYDMIDEDAKNNTRATVAGRLSEAPTDSGRLQWLNAKEDTEGKVYRGHGLRESVRRWHTSDRCRLRTHGAEVV